MGRWLTPPTLGAWREGGAPCSGHLHLPLLPAHTCGGSCGQVGGPGSTGGRVSATLLGAQYTVHCAPPHTSLCSVHNTRCTVLHITLHCSALCSVHTTHSIVLHYTLHCAVHCHTHCAGHQTSPLYHTTPQALPEIKLRNQHCGTLSPPYV